MIPHEEGASGAGSSTEDEIMSAPHEQGALGPESVTAMDLAKAIVTAWDALPDGQHTMRTVERWLISDVQPLVFKARAMLSAPASGAERMTAGEDLAALSAKAAAGPWHVDMFPFRDVETGEEQPPQCEGICTHDEAGGLADSIATCSEPEARFVVALVNAYRSGKLTPTPATPPGVPDSVRPLRLCARGRPGPLWTGGGLIMGAAVDVRCPHCKGKSFSLYERLGACPSNPLDGEAGG
ncbi:hypothetical protein [Methylobacterium sp. B4]|uniref:hypothetical protein n=1 Tax=Methylobacterium sp. B4 TaxID=1938755 RepID=UPI000D755C7C|nr:hypothetical protein [Methylobacterium sp. B4]PXW50705.1 hypothetical protein BY998_1401 [Methylobacterium sp. B4]